MKTAVERIGDHRVKLTIEIEPKELDGAMTRTFRKLSSEVNIPGFRKGKAPRAILELRLGKDAVYGAMMEDEGPAWTSDAIEAERLLPSGSMDFDHEEIEDGKPVIITLEMDVKPEVDLGDYKKVKIPEMKAEPDDEEITKYIDSLREKFATLNIAENKVIEEGDFAVVNYSAAVDFEAVEGASKEDFEMEVGTKTLGEDVDKELIGKRKGDIVEVKTKLYSVEKEDESEEKLATIKVLIKEVKEKILPELEDFVKDVSEYESVEEYREYTRNLMIEEREKRMEAALPHVVLHRLMSTREIHLPESMIEDYVESKEDRFVERLRSRGIDKDRYLEYLGMTEDDMKNEMENEARVELQRELVLDMIAKSEGIDVSEAEIDEEISRTAQEIGTQKSKFKTELVKAGRKWFLTESIRRKKAFELLSEYAVQVSEDEIEEEDKEISKIRDANKADEVEKTDEKLEGTDESDNEGTESSERPQKEEDAADGDSEEEKDEN